VLKQRIKQELAKAVEFIRESAKFSIFALGQSELDRSYSLIASSSLPSTRAKTSFSFLVCLSTIFSTLCSIGSSPLPSHAFALLMISCDRLMTSSSAFLMVAVTLMTRITTGVSTGFGRCVMYVRAAHTIS
jgi:hypothetical protein